jgi:transcriptional regulator with XRE-family HTH domain
MNSRQHFGMKRRPEECFHERVAREVIRAIRGKRSQVALARRLGYKGNPITDWERGARSPSAKEVLRVAAVCRLPVREAFLKLVPIEPPSVDAPQGKHKGTRQTREWSLHVWLTALRGNVSNTELSQRLGTSRYTVSRWCSGVTDIKFHEFIRLVDALTGRLYDWVAALVPIESVPALMPRFAQAHAARTVALEHPWTEAILRVLETERYRQQPAVAHASLAATLGIDEDTLKRALAGLVEAQVVSHRQDSVTGFAYYEVLRELSVDTRSDPEAIRRLQEHWLGVALERAVRREPDWFAYNVFSCSHSDLARVRDTLKRTFRESRATIASSQPNETTGFLLLQIGAWQ